MSVLVIYGRCAYNHKEGRQTDEYGDKTESERERERDGREKERERGERERERERERRLRGEEVRRTKR